MQPYTSSIWKSPKKNEKVKTKTHFWIKLQENSNTFLIFSKSNWVLPVESGERLRRDFKMSVVRAQPWQISGNATKIHFLKVRCVPWETEAGPFAEQKQKVTFHPNRTITSSVKKRKDSDQEDIFSGGILALCKLWEEEDLCILKLCWTGMLTGLSQESCYKYLV